MSLCLRRDLLNRSCKQSALDEGNDEKNDYIQDDILLALEPTDPVYFSRFPSHYHCPYTLRS
jgi:hypothetical protein